MRNRSIVLISALALLAGGPGVRAQGSRFATGIRNAVGMTCDVRGRISRVFYRGE